MANYPKGVATYNSVLRTLINDFLKSELKRKGNSELVPSHGSILHYIYEQDGKVQIKDIYDVMPKRKSTITEMIKRLVKLGYLKKEQCPQDKRVTYVYATQKALDFESDFREVSQNLHDKVFNNFTIEEAEELVRLIKKASRNFT